MDRYTLLQKIGIYCGIAVFLTFILLPFLGDVPHQPVADEPPVPRTL